MVRHFLTSINIIIFVCFFAVLLAPVNEIQARNPAKYRFQNPASYRNQEPISKNRHINAKKLITRKYSQRNNHCLATPTYLKYYQLLKNKKIKTAIAPIFEKSNNISYENKLWQTLCEIESGKTVSAVKDLSFANKTIVGITAEQMKTMWVVQVAYVLYSEVHKIYPWSIKTLSEENTYTLLGLCSRYWYENSLEDVFSNEEGEYCGSQFWHAQAEGYYTMKRTWIHDPTKIFELAQEYVASINPTTRDEAITNLSDYLLENNWHHPIKIQNELQKYLKEANSYFADELDPFFLNNAYQSLNYVKVKGEVGSEHLPLGEEILEINQVGCQEGTFLFQMIYRMMGIPIIPIASGGHWGMYFPSVENSYEGLYMAHTDDYYLPIAGMAYPTFEPLFFYVTEDSPFHQQENSCTQHYKNQKAFTDNLFYYWSNGTLEEQEVIQRFYCEESWKTDLGEKLESFFYFIAPPVNSYDGCPVDPGALLVSEEIYEEFMASVVEETDCSGPNMSNKALFKEIAESQYECKNVNDVYDQENRESVVLYQNNEPVKTYQRYCTPGGVLEVPACLNNYNPDAVYGESMYNAYTSSSWVYKTEVLCENGCKVGWCK